MDNKLHKLLDFVRREEDKYYDLGIKEMEKNNPVGNMIMTVQATSFQRVRYAIEDLLESE